MRGSEAARQEFSKAVYNLIQGAVVNVYNQPTSALSLTVGDTPGNYSIVKVAQFLI